MAFIKKNIDGIAGVAAIGWGSVVALVPDAAPLAEFISPSAAFVFGVVALGRWYAGIRAS